jgi:hypothetical protein
MAMICAASRLICRKSTLAVVLARADDGIEVNDHMEHDDAETRVSERLQT